MTIFADGLIESGYITIDDTGWHCDDNAPDDIKYKFDEFIRSVSSMASIDD